MRHIFWLSFFFFFVIGCPLFAKEPKEIARELSLVPASKASVQWERIFKSERKLKKYNLDKLSQDERDALKNYLISHAADSDLPQYAGDV